MNADVHALAGAYALDALPPDEATEFQEHLADCDSCQEEVAELQITATHLGVAAAEQPPPRVREAVLQAARQTRQVPPVTPIQRHADLPRRRRMWLAAAAAVVVVGAGAAGLTAVLDNNEPASDPLAAVVAAPDAAVTTTPMRGGGQLTVVSSEQLGQAIVLSEDLPPTAADRVYQLWLVNPDGQARSADVLVDSPGAANLVRGVEPGDQVAITREPAGGSEQPTMTPLAISKAV